VKKITAPSAKQSASQETTVKDKAAQFALKLTQPLASMPPTEQNLAQTAPATQTNDGSDAPHYFNQVFILE
jgi:hypothetical protein